MSKFPEFIIPIPGNKYLSCSEILMNFTPDGHMHLYTVDEDFSITGLSNEEVKEMLADDRLPVTRVPDFVDVYFEMDEFKPGGLLS